MSEKRAFALKIDPGERGDTFELPPAEGPVGFAAGVAGTVRRRCDDGLHFGKQLPGLVVQQRLDEPFPQIVDGPGRGVDQIVGVEAVVAQVVREDLEGREVERLRKAFGELLDGHPQRGLADGIPRQTVPEMTHRTDRQQNLLAGQRSLEEPVEGLDNLRDAQPPTDEFRGGAAMTVGDHLSVVFVDPGRAEGQDHPIGRAERLGPCLSGTVHALQGLLGGRCGEFAVEVEVVPEFAVEAQFVTGDGPGIGVAVERPGNRQRIEENARGICDNVEFRCGKPVGDVRGEARSEGEDAVAVSDLQIGAERFDFGAEFHTAKIENLYFCSMILRANCKINLGLEILRRRADGYHDLETVMFPVRGLYDEVEVERSGVPGVAFRTEGLVVDCPEEENICLKAFRLMRDRYGVDGVRIHLVKRVPFGAGLGGGSADATAVVLALDRLFALGLSEAELIARAAELGSDTAFFVRNTPQLCTGRGEVMTPFPLELKGLTLVLVKPDEKVSTREAYAGVHPRIPEIPLAERLQRPVAEWQGSVVNRFEESVFAVHPAIRDVKERLLGAGALYASMSGSGSAVFGLFAGHEKGEELHALSPFVFEL